MKYWHWGVQSQHSTDEVTELAASVTLTTATVSFVGRSSDTGSLAPKSLPPLTTMHSQRERARPEKFAQWERNLQPTKAENTAVAVPRLLLFSPALSLSASPKTPRPTFHSNFEAVLSDKKKNHNTLLAVASITALHLRAKRQKSEKLVAGTLEVFTAKCRLYLLILWRSILLHISMAGESW